MAKSNKMQGKIFPAKLTKLMAYTFFPCSRSDVSYKCMFRERRKSLVNWWLRILEFSQHQLFSKVWQEGERGGEDGRQPVVWKVCMTKVTTSAASASLMSIVFNLRKSHTQSTDDTMPKVSFKCLSIIQERSLCVQESSLGGLNIGKVVINPTLVEIHILGPKKYFILFFFSNGQFFNL